MKMHRYEEKGFKTELHLVGEKDTIVLKGKSLTNLIMKYKAKMFFISGRILEDDFESLKLAKWSLVSSEKKEHLRKMILRIVKADNIVREIEINNVHVINYDGNYGTMTYSISLAQHNRNSAYKSMPVETKYGRGYLVLQGKDEKTNMFLNNISLGLNAAGSLVVLNAGKNVALRYLGIGTKSFIQTDMSFLARFNLYYLATHGTNLVISTSADIYFKAIGYEEGVGKVNPLKTIYEELGALIGKSFDKSRGGNYYEKKGKNIGKEAYNWVDLSGALLGAGTDLKEVTNSLKYGKNISYRIKFNKNFTYAVRKYKMSYMILAGGATARDINPIISDSKELSK
ncbi:hypothetical protein [Haliovirga abyssi]|uniref:Uncharacterized protein n=1 Tax=Haliovirga abyssi TaxID=2996794 RepID=A0AAU9DGV2_9FUSO|nr:hypothetical protein [Haliovirga abyssi]BDU50692.1 hypothetical protein HLVA_12610 [Haliovirga abyssi]